MERTFARSEGSHPVVPATPADARGLAVAHSAAFPNSLLSRLGVWFLEYVYRAMASDPHAVVLVAREGGRIAGFAAALENPSAFWQGLRRHHRVRLILMLAPRALMASVRKQVREVAGHIQRNQMGGPELMAVAVGPPSRRSGLGMRLVMLTEEELRKAGADRLTVVVRNDNRQARDFFERLGFHALGPAAIHQGQPALRYEKPLWSASVARPVRPRARPTSPG